MKPLKEFPDVPEGLEREVNQLYSSTAGDNGFSKYFRNRSEAFRISESQAQELDYLVDWMYGTYAAVQAIDSGNRRVPEVSLEWDAFTAAAFGAYAAAGLFVEDAEPVLNLSRKLRLMVSPLLDIYYLLECEPEEANAILDSAEGEGFSLEQVEKGASSVLGEKLRFEAGVYAGLKKAYGITVAIPS